MTTDRSEQSGPEVAPPTRPSPYSEPGDESVHERGVADCPKCHTPCRTEKVLWYDRHLGTQSRIDYIPDSSHQQAVEALRAEVERLNAACADALECGNDGDWQSARQALAAAIAPQEVR